MFHLLAEALPFMESDEKKVLEIIKAQKCFFTSHLIKWVPDFLKAVTEHAETDFFKGVALLCQGCLKKTEEVLNNL